jgi:peptide/nickel transport system permease protein
MTAITTASGGNGTGAADSSRLSAAHVWKMLKRRKQVAIGLAVLITLVCLALFAPWVSDASPTAMHISHRLRAPGAQYWFGTDEFGRDLFTRVIHGGRVSLAVALLSVCFACCFGIVLGVLSGFFSKLDGTLIKVIDAMMAFPEMLLAISLVSIFGPSVLNVVMALGIVYTPRIARVARASTLVIRELPFVEAARALGVSTPRILQRHILRNLASPIIVQSTFLFAQAILAESGLSFLGVGVSPDVPTWGTIISAGQQYSREASWIMLFPGLAIAAAVFSLQLVGDSLRDLLDPKLLKDL